jgi:hypothetical protein
MTGVTTLMAPPLLRYLFRGEIPKPRPHRAGAALQL